MKVSDLNQNFSANAYTPKANVAFKGVRQINRDLTKQISESSPGLIKFLTKLGKNNGEILNTVVTAIGTAFVAPIFIAFNPFSKEDKDTKVYSALRQPISAVIAVLIQIGVISKFNNWLDHVASVDILQSKPQVSYLKKMLKWQQPGISKDAIANQIEKIQDDAFWNEVNTQREKLKNADIDYKTLIDANAYKTAQGNVLDEFKSEIKGMSKKEAKKFIDEETMKRAAQNIEAEVYDEAVVKERIAKLAQGSTPFDEALRGLKEHRSTQIDEFVDKILKDVKSGEKVDKKTLTSVMEKLMESNKSIKEFFKDLRLDKDQAELEKIIKKELKALLSSGDYSEQVRELRRANRVIEKLDNSGAFEKCKKYLGKRFDEILQSVKIKRMVKATINNGEGVLKCTKKWGGLVLSLLTLPVSCGLLNWAYPRIMEKVMPQVAQKKKAKEVK